MTEEERQLRAERRRRGIRGRVPRGFHKDLRSQRLWQKYEMTPRQFDALLAMQGGRCAICGTDNPKSKHGVFHVDHCHETGRIRGILCNPCNVAIGKLGDTPEALLKVYNYLSRREDVLKGLAL